MLCFWLFLTSIIFGVNCLNCTIQFIQFENGCFSVCSIQNSTGKTGCIKYHLLSSKNRLFSNCINNSVIFNQIIWKFINFSQIVRIFWKIGKLYSFSRTIGRIVWKFIFRKIFSRTGSDTTYSLSAFPFSCFALCHFRIMSYNAQIRLIFAFCIINGIFIYLHNKNAILGQIWAFYVCFIT